MYKVPVNSRLITHQQSKRTMSTAPTVHKGGLSKVFVGALFVGAAGMAYYNRIQKDNEFYNGSSDPYERTKKNVSQLGDKMAHDGKEKGREALDELNAAGRHIQNSAASAGQAAQDAFSDAKREGQAAVDSFKQESEGLKHNLRSEVDKFASEHHLKEGERTPEDVLSHNDHAIFDKSPSTAKSSETNKAAFNASNKFKETKDNISNDVKRATDYLKEEKDKAFNKVQEHNPMVYEKVSSNKTKPDWETKLVAHANDVVRDTSRLVEKDTNKVKQVWDDKSNEASDKAHEVKEKAEPAVKGLWGSSSTSYPESNPMVEEKRTSQRTKPDWEQRLESHANDVIHDTSELVKKDTKKVEPIWNDEKNAASDAASNAAQAVEGEAKSFWGNIFGSGDNHASKIVENDRKPAIPQKKYTTYDHVATARQGNPMVLEKLSKGQTKPLWETSLEEHAEHVTHDTSPLVDKDTEKVKKGVWDAKERANDKHPSAIRKVEANVGEVVEEVEEGASSLWSSVFGKARDVKKDADNAWEDTKGKAESGANHVKRNVNSTIDDLSDNFQKRASPLSSTWSDVKETASDEAQKLKDQGTRISRQASDRAGYEKDRLSHNLNDLHEEVSSNTDKWKAQTEQNAKSWYQKGTEQVKSGFSTVKNVADQDIQWAEEKVQDGVDGIKDEASRMFGFRDEKKEDIRGGGSFAEDEAGNLTANRLHTKSKPASVVVEEAHGKEF